MLHYHSQGLDFVLTLPSSSDSCHFTFFLRCRQCLLNNAFSHDIRLLLLLRLQRCNSPVGWQRLLCFAKVQVNGHFCAPMRMQSQSPRECELGDVGSFNLSRTSFVSASIWPCIAA